MGSEQVVLFGSFSEDESRFFQSVPVGPPRAIKPPILPPVPVAEESPHHFVADPSPPLPSHFPHHHGQSLPLQHLQAMPNGTLPPVSFPTHPPFEARHLPLVMDPSVSAGPSGAPVGGGLMMPPHMSWPPRMDMAPAGTPITVSPPPHWGPVVSGSPSHVGLPAHPPPHPQMMMMMSGGIPAFPMPPPPLGAGGAPAPFVGAPFLPLPPSQLLADGLPLRPFPPPHLPPSSLPPGGPVGPMSAYPPMLINPPPAPPLHHRPIPPAPHHVSPHEEGLHMLPSFVPTLPSSEPQMAGGPSLPCFVSPYGGGSSNVRMNSAEGSGEAGRSAPVAWPAAYRPSLGTPVGWTLPNTNAPPPPALSQPPLAQVPDPSPSATSSSSMPLKPSSVPPSAVAVTTPMLGGHSLQAQSSPDEGVSQSLPDVVADVVNLSVSSQLGQPSLTVQEQLPQQQEAGEGLAAPVSDDATLDQGAANGAQVPAVDTEPHPAAAAPPPPAEVAPPLLPFPQVQNHQQQEQRQQPPPAVVEPSSAPVSHSQSLSTPAPSAVVSSATPSAPPTGTSAAPPIAPVAPPPAVPVKPKTWAKLFTPAAGSPNQQLGFSSPLPSNFPGAQTKGRPHPAVGQSGRSNGVSVGEGASASAVSSAMPAAGAARQQHGWGNSLPGDSQRQGAANGLASSSSATSGTAPLCLSGTAWVKSVVQAESSAEKRMRVRPRGLVNAGNTCFLNATLQGLLACSPFCHLLQLLAQRRSSLRQDLYPTLYAFSEFLREFELIRSSAAPSLPAPAGSNGTNNSSSGGSGSGATGPIDVGRPFAPTMFDSVLARFSGTKFHVAATGPEIRKSMRQEDAQEFLLFLMDRMHEELLHLEGAGGQGQGSAAGPGSNTAPASSLTAAPAPPPGEAVTAGVSAEGEEEEEWETVGPKNKTAVTRTHASSGGESAVSDIFGGQLRSVVKTKGVRASATVQPFLLLQLDIAPESVHSLEDALSLFAAPESLDGYKASGAGRAEVVTAKKDVKLQSLPRILVLHLMRFSYGPLGSSKVHKPVRFPASLTLARELLASNAGSAEARRYELVASVSHRGKELSGGHYTADVRQPNGQWLRFDDSHVSAIPLKVALHDQAYLLIYKRVLVTAGSTSAAVGSEDS
eukprot:TRINITY_DN704_c0_g5_i1.p1 TRINITY_DN704_c0_g5~~TRINITY_DN704_c0_g5_i1.p1  ORF type:complete len:1137 (+),score=257.14 TRINITY_DN704_c0_g5_i1:236-3646(+)